MIPIALSLSLSLAKTFGLLELGWDVAVSPLLVGFIVDSINNFFGNNHSNVFAKGG